MLSRQNTIAIKSCTDHGCFTPVPFISIL